MIKNGLGLIDSVLSEPIEWAEFCLDRLPFHIVNQGQIFYLKHFTSNYFSINSQGQQEPKHRMEITASDGLDRPFGSLGTMVQERACNVGICGEELVRISNTFEDKMHIIVVFLEGITF